MQAVPRPGLIQPMVVLGKGHRILVPLFQCVRGHRFCGVQSVTQKNEVLCLTCHRVLGHKILGMVLLVAVEATLRESSHLNLPLELSAWRDWLLSSSKGPLNVRERRNASSNPGFRATLPRQTWPYQILDWWAGGQKAFLTL